MNTLAFLVSAIKFLALSVGMTSLLGLSLILLYMAYGEYRHSKRNCKHTKPRSSRSKEEDQWTEVDHLVNHDSKNRNLSEDLAVWEQTEDVQALLEHELRRDGIVFGPLATYGNLHTPRYTNSNYDGPVRLAEVRPIRKGYYNRDAI